MWKEYFESLLKEIQVAPEDNGSAKIEPIYRRKY